MPYMRPPARSTPTQGRVLPRNGAAVMSPLPVPACIVIMSPLRQYYAASCRDAGGIGFGVRYCEAGGRGGGVLMSSRVYVRRVSTILTPVRFIYARQLLSVATTFVRIDVHRVTPPVEYEVLLRRHKLANSHVRARRCEGFICC